jgi:hypothetical protein
MTSFSRILLVLALIFLFSLLKSQETIIKVPFSQPKKLTLDAGENQVLSAGQTITLGTDVSITGGTPGYRYTWKDSGNSEYSTPTISVSEAGSYYLIVTDEKQCMAIDSVIVSEFSAIENSESVTGFSLFPNPSQGVFFYRIIKPESKEILEIISEGGRVVYKKEFGSAHGDLTGFIDLTGYGKGLYYVKLMRNGSSQVKPVIIQ